MLFGAYQIYKINRTRWKFNSRVFQTVELRPSLKNYCLQNKMCIKMSSLRSAEHSSNMQRLPGWQLGLCGGDREDGGGGIGGVAARVCASVSVCVWVCVCQSVSWLSRARRRQDGLLLLGLVQGHTAGSPLPCPGADMFDNANYPFNCFNYDGDGYPSSSTDEEKKMCRPAYR